MSDIKTYPFLSHLRTEPSVHVLRYRRGSLERSGRGEAFWFRPRVSAVAEVPVDDREQSIVTTGRTLDFQDITMQGTVTFRIADPELAATRIDFGVDLRTGRYLEEPLDRLADLVAGAAQQITLDWVAHRTLDAALREAVQELRPLVTAGLQDDASLSDAGIQIATVHITRVSPTPELEKALQAPTREGLQEAADEATFQRRALAVEKERAIEENALANRIELARREQDLIRQEGANGLRRAEDDAATNRIEAEAQAERATMSAGARAEGISLVEAARNEAEAARLDAYRTMEPMILLGLAAQELASKLERIDHLNLSPDALSGMVQSLVSAGTTKLES